MVTRSIKFVLYGIFFVTFVSGIGECENQRKENELASRTPYKWQYNLGIEPSNKPTRVIRITKDLTEDKYLTKEEFYEGMEDAEMKGMADDPSAQEIYDEFNR